MFQVLRTLCAERGTRNWVGLLTPAEMAINNAPIATTEYTPYSLTYGYHPILPYDFPSRLPTLPSTA